MKSVTIKHVTLGSGIPKICAPLVAENWQRLQSEAASLSDLPIDIAEWRGDRYPDILKKDCISKVLPLLRQTLGELPLIFTFRTAQEGGSQTASPSSYCSLLEAAICSGYIDAVDIELFSSEHTLKKLIPLAHQHHVKVILSNHDFNSTPCQRELVKRLHQMESLGGDIAKIAVMPKKEEDVLTLLSATLTARRSLSCPIITMSMNGMGLVSRLSGEVFGSCLTFGSIKEASAPGQISVSELKELLEMIHKSHPLL